MNDKMENLQPYERLSIDIGTFIASNNPKEDVDVVLQALELTLVSIAVSVGADKEAVMENVSTLFDLCSGAYEAMQVLDRFKKH